MYFLNNGNGTNFITYKSVTQLRANFQERIAYESQGLPVLVDELQDCLITTATQNCTSLFPMIFVIKL